jgi:hypothetical protein
MKTVKVYCYLCKKEPDKKRIFDVNASSISIVCPNCGKTIDVAMGREAYKNKIDFLYKKAQITLEDKADYISAYKMFSYIISIDEKNVPAIFGRIIALLKMSTLRVSKIESSSALFTQATRWVEMQQCDPTIHLSYLHEIFDILKFYIAKVHNRLTYKNDFYDCECLKLYLLRVKETINFLNSIVNEINNIASRFKNVQLDSAQALKEVGLYSNKLSTLLNAQYVLVDGSKINAFLTPSSDLLLSIDEKSKNMVKKFPHRLMSLYPIDNKTKYIKDTIFKNRIFAYNLNKYSIYIASIFLLLAIIFAFLIIFNVITKISFFLLIGFLSIGVLFLLSKFLTRKKNN